MIVSTTHKKIVLNLRNPARVTTVIPTAKVFKYKGADLVAIPHRLDETRVLRNLGFQVPSPVSVHYDFPGMHRPFAAQRDTTAFLSLNQKAFVLNDMGTGKTLAALWTYDYLKSIGKVNKLLIVSPLSTLERTWADEVFRNFPHLNVSVLYGTKDRRLKMLAQDADIYLINHDGIKILEKELIARKDIDIAIVDEIAAFRNATTTRWKCLHRIVKDKPWLWGLTGTPTPNAPTDAWAQCRLICPERVPKYAGAFRDAVLRQVGPFQWVPRDTATDIVAQAMQPSIRFSRKDCVDLPPCLVQTRHVPMSSDQRSAYKEMVNSMVTEYNGDTAQAVNEAVKLNKLLQIACGVVYGANDALIKLPSADRITEVRDIIDQAGAKVIVFVPFKGVLEHVANELKQHYTVEMISGGTSKGERDRIFGSFMREKAPHVLVAQPAAMAHGLTLTAADTIVWFAPITSNEIYEQANARVSRPGQTRSQLIVNIEGSHAERHLYSRLNGKQKTQGSLLSIIRDQKQV